jgi:hypothetical protein
MKALFYISIFLLVIGIYSCENLKPETSETKRSEFTPTPIKPEVVTDIVFNDSLRYEMNRRGLKVIQRTARALKKELKQAIERDGIENAVTFCSAKAMEITDSMSVAYQVEIERLAKKYRNPLNETINEDSTIFKTYIINWLMGVSLQPLVRWNEEGHPVYYHPIKVEALCLNCHGRKENIPEGVANRIAQLYPGDKAVDFKEGQLRGMWKVTFPELRIVDVDLSTEAQ